MKAEWQKDGEVSLPWQNDILAWQRPPQQWSSQQKLCYAILWDAVELIQGHYHGLRQEREAAVRWVQSRECDYLFDFESVCLTLGFDAGWIRVGVLGDGRRAA